MYWFYVKLNRKSLKRIAFRATKEKSQFLSQDALNILIPTLLGLREALVFI